MKHPTSFARRSRTLAACLILITALTSVASARPKQMRVDSDRIDLPEQLEPAWEQVLRHRGWTSTEHGELGENARFSRFLPRSYELRKSGENLLLTTRWADQERCLTTQRNTLSIEKKRKAVLEAALGVDFTELETAEEDAAVPEQKFVVLWCQFRTASQELVVLTSLSEADQKLLGPFVDLATAHLESNTGRNAKCDPAEVRRARKKQRSSRGRPKSSAGGPVPPGGVSVGPSATGTVGAVRFKRSTDSSDKRDQKYGVLIAEYRAIAGSLEFQKVREFTRCIMAASASEALSRARAAFPAVISQGSGERISYRVSLGGACGSQSNGTGAGTDIPTGETMNGDDSNDGPMTSALSPEPDSIGDEPYGPMYGEDSGYDDGLSDPYATDDIPYPDDYGDYESYYEDGPELALEPTGPSQ